jgi:hypothetical protein
MRTEVMTSLFTLRKPPRPASDTNSRSMGRITLATWAESPPGRRLTPTHGKLVAKANGKVTETDTSKLAADGETLTDNTKQMKADGGSMESTTVHERASGGRRPPGNGRPGRSRATRE